MVILLVILLFIWSKRALSSLMIHLSQTFFWRIRNQIIRMVLNSNYENVYERKDKIHATLIQDVGLLTNASLSIVEFSTSVIIMLGCFIYMFFLSSTLFLIVLVTAVLGAGIYLLRGRKSTAEFEKSRTLEEVFLFHFEAILFGVKEIDINPDKGESIYNDKIVPLAQNSYKNNKVAFTSFLNNQMIGQVLFYLLISTILLVLSVKLNIEKEVSVNFILILLYVLGAIETIMVLLPSLLQAKVSLSRINQLKLDLEANGRNENAISKKLTKQDFENISINEIVYKYPQTNDSTFTIGPISCLLKKDELVFIYGGNGSGKTTFIHTLLGMLSISEGQILFNDLVLNVDTNRTYKSLFSVVFNDFYLFDEFYGNSDFNRGKANELLHLFEIAGKVEIVDTGFSVTNLSTGQRKRLALIAAILEERPIIVLDEWAADQDPYFRKKFYEEILPILKKDGFTIIAITHDDRYYHCADKIYKMEFGKLYDETILFHENRIENVQ